MLHKTVFNDFKKTYLIYKTLLVRHSALFINGPKATESYVYVTPHIDIPEYRQNKDVIIKQLSRRKSNLDFNKLENLWAMYEELKDRRDRYSEKKAKISRELGKLIKDEPDSEGATKLRLQHDLVKDNIRKLKVPLWSAEEAAMIESLKLPNDLHALTPDGDKKIIYEHLTPPNSSNNHKDIGEKLGLIKFKNNQSYYLENDAAIFELGAKFFFSHLLKENNFVQFSNTDFVKSLIIEACGRDHTDPSSSFILHHNEESNVNANNRLHLTGGASLCSFIAYYAKNVLYSKVLPMKFFSMGRQYSPVTSDGYNLFNTSQSTAIEIFGAAKNATEIDAMCEEVIEFLKNTYSQLGYHFRLSVIPADKLEMWESLRVAVEMYSTSCHKYIEVGNVSLSGDFISKRVMFTYVDKKESSFPHIVSGTVLNVPRLLACAIEHDKEFTLPNLFSVQKWKM